MIETGAFLTSAAGCRQRRRWRFRRPAGLSARGRQKSSMGRRNRRTTSSSAVARHAPQRPTKSRPSRSASQSDPARTRSPSPTRSCERSRRSKGRSFRAMSKSRSRAITAKPPRKNRTSCCCTWVWPSSAFRCSSGSRSAGASRPSSRIAIPATLALTLLVFYLLGFTLNRITLFALIFSHRHSGR